MPKVEFIRVTSLTCEKLRVWRNSPRIRTNMFSDVEITSTQQADWLASLEHDQTQRYYVCYLDGTPIGSLYFININEVSCEWGCYIGEERIWPGLGLVMEFAALKFAFETLNVERLNAEVLNFNLVAQKMHRLFKYTELSERKTGIYRDGTELVSVPFYYQRDAWLMNRQKVIQLLPKGLVKVSEATTFRD